MPQHQSMEVPTQPQGQVDRQYLVLHHCAQRHQHDAAQQYQANAPQHATFLRGRVAASLPGGQQIHDLPEEGKQPGFVNRHTGAQQRKRKDVTACPSRAGPQKPCQTVRWRRHLVRREGVKPFFKRAKHGVLQKNQCKESGVVDASRTSSRLSFRVNVCRRHCPGCPTASSPGSLQRPVWHVGHRRAPV